MKVFVCLILALKLVTGQYPQWASEDYTLAQQPQYYEQLADDPVVGSALIDPLIGLKLKAPFIFGVPGLRFNNLNLGRVGHLSYANSILGAPNPNAEENIETIVPQQADYQVASQQQYPVDQYQQYYYQQADPQVGAPQDPQEFYKWWWFANPEQQVGAPHYQHDYQPQVQQYNYQVPQYQYNQQVVTAPQNHQSVEPQLSADERSWSWNKG
jgi:hypothetical protein